MNLDRIREMEEALNKASARFDDSEPGAQVVGEVVEIRTVDGKHGPFRIVVLETPTGFVEVSASRAVLARELDERQVASGDLLGVRYEGTRQTRTGSEYHAYTIQHSRGDRPAAAPAKAKKQTSTPVEHDEEPF